MVSITKYELLQVHKPWRKERSGCYVLLRDVQVYRHPRTRLPISLGYNQIVLQIDEFQRNGSGLIVDHL